MKIDKSVRDATSVALLMRRHHGQGAIEFVRKQIALFEQDPGRTKAAEAWRRVLKVLVTTSPQRDTTSD